MFFNMGTQEMLIIGCLAVLLFGKNLPEVAKKLGQSYTQFRKGLSEIQSQLQMDEDTLSANGSSSNYADDDYDDYDAPIAPKFEPPTSEPTEAEEV